VAPAREHSLHTRGKASNRGLLYMLMSMGGNDTLSLLPAYPIFWLFINRNTLNEMSILHLYHEGKKIFLHSAIQYISRLAFSFLILYCCVHNGKIQQFLNCLENSQKSWKIFLIQRPEFQCAKVVPKTGRYARLQYTKIPTSGYSGLLLLNYDVNFETNRTTALL
jgi:hypothetical protein